MQSPIGVDAIRAEYEASVLALRELFDRMQREGHDEEAIARALHAERRAIAARFKSLTPEPFRSQVDARTLAVYGDTSGPTIEWLRANGKSWRAIIESAMRPGAGPTR